MAINFKLCFLLGERERERGWSTFLILARREMHYTRAAGIISPNALHISKDDKLFEKRNTCLDTPLNLQYI